MKKITLTLIASLALITPAHAVTPIHEQCDAGIEQACLELTLRTGGQCASPRGLGGCAYDSLTTY